jgi:nicotinamide-nucleotide amidase
MKEATRGPRSVPDLVRELGEALRTLDWKMAVAESCTGGGLGAAITDQPGSSSFFLGGVVAYDNRLKRTLLGVTDEALTEVGAVSLRVAERMAAGCRLRLDADVAVSITGIAGPGGGTADKPVGLVFIAVATASATSARRFVFSGDRADVRRQAVQAALLATLRAVRRRLDGVECSR